MEVNPATPYTPLHPSFLGLAHLSLAVATPTSSALQYGSGPRRRQERSGPTGAAGTGAHRTGGLPACDIRGTLIIQSGSLLFDWVVTGSTSPRLGWTPVTVWELKQGRALLCWTLTRNVHCRRLKYFAALHTWHIQVWPWKDPWLLTLTQVDLITVKINTSS